MNIQQTSLQAYEQVQPKIGKNQQIIFNLIYIHEGITDAEIGNTLDWPINTVTPRRNELVKLGLIYSKGVRLCKITKNTANEWVQHGN